MSNAVLQLFREKAAGGLDGVSDDVLTQYIYERHPQFLKVPEFRESVRAKIAAETARNEAYTGRGGSGDVVTSEEETKGRVGSALAAGMSAGGSAAGRTVSGLARWLAKVAPYQAAGSDNPTVQEAGLSEIARRRAADPAVLENELRSEPFFQAGQAISGAAREAYPSNRAFDEELGQQLATTVGELPIMLAASAVNPALGVAQYSLAAGENAAEEAIAYGRPDLADKTANLNTAVAGGSTLLLSPLARLPAIRRLAAQKGVLNTIRNTATGEAGQEAIEQLGGNVIASDLSGYDPERSVGDGVIQAAVLGGIVGGGLGGGFEGVNSLNRRYRKANIDRIRAERREQRDVSLANAMAEGRKQAEINRMLDNARPFLEAEEARLRGRGVSIEAPPVMPPPLPPGAGGAGLSISAPPVLPPPLPGRTPPPLPQPGTGEVEVSQPPVMPPPLPRETPPPLPAQPTPPRVRAVSTKPSKPAEAPQPTVAAEDAVPLFVDQEAAVEEEAQPARDLNIQTVQSETRQEPEEQSAQEYSESDEVEVTSPIIAGLEEQTKTTLAKSVLRGTYRGVDADGNMLIELTSLGKKRTTGAEKAGLSIGQTVAVASNKGVSKYIAPAQKEPGKAGRKVSEESKEFIDRSNKVASDFPDEVADVSRLLRQTDSAIPAGVDGAEISERFSVLDQLHGREKAVLIVASALRANLYRMIDVALPDAPNSGQVATKIEADIRRWASAAMSSSGSLHPFAARGTLSRAKLDARRSAQDLQTVSLDTPLGEDTSTSLIDRVVAREAGSAETDLVTTAAGEKAAEGSGSVSVIPANVIGGDVLAELSDAERKAGGRKLTDPEIELAVARAYAALATREPYLSVARSQNIPQQALEKRLADRSLSVSGDVTAAYREGGVEGVREAINDNAISFAGPGPATAADANLDAGVTTVPEAAAKLFSGTPDGAELGRVVDKAVASGVASKVEVVSDDDFDASHPNAPSRNALYDSETDTIRIRQSAPNHDYLLAHEVVHAATVRALRMDTEFLEAMLVLRTEAAELLGDVGVYGLEDHGGAFANAAEFVAEAMSNPDFQKALDSAEAVRRSIWQKFKDLIARLLGFKPAHGKLLTRVLEAANREFGPSTEGPGGPLFAARLFRDDVEVTEALSLTDNDEGRAAIEASAGAVSQLIPETVVGAAINNLDPHTIAHDLNDQIRNAPDASTRAALVQQFRAQVGMSVTEWRRSPNRAAARRLEPLMRMSQAGTPVRLADMPTGTESEARIRREAAVVTDRAAMRVEDAVRSAEQDSAALFNEYTDPNSDLNRELADLRTAAGAATVTARAAARSFSDYLSDQRALAKFEGKSEPEAAKEFAAATRRKLRETTAIADALRILAEQIDPSVLAAAGSNRDILNEVASRGLLNGHAAEALMLPNASGRGGILLTYRGLLNALRHMSDLRYRHSAAQARIDAFEQSIATLRRYRRARRVSVGSFINAYNAIRDVEVGLQTVGGRLEDLRRRAETLRLYGRALTEITESNEYTEQRDASAQIIDKMIYGFSGRDVGNHHVLEFGDTDPSLPPDHPYRVEEFRFNNAANDVRAFEDNLVVYMKAIGKIEAMLSDSSRKYTPEFRNALRHLKLKLQSEMDARPEGGLMLNSFDAIGFARRMIGIRNFTTANLPSWLMNGRIGVELRKLETAIDSIHLRIQKLRSHRTHGRRAIEQAAREAVVSHADDIPGRFRGNEELENEWWVVHVLEQVLSQNQDAKGRTVGVGDYTTGNIRITQADMAAAKRIAAWSNALRQIVEGTPGAAELFPTRVITDRGRYARLSYASGALTVPRILDRSQTPSGTSASPMDLSTRWMAADDAGRAALLDDPSFFDVVVLPYVADLNPEFVDSRRTAFGPVFTTLATEWRRNGFHPTTTDALVAQISERVPRAVTGQVGGVDIYETDDEVNARVRATLTAEINRVIESFTQQAAETGAANAEGLREYMGPADSSEATLLTHLDAENSFRRQRVNMVAPSSFYRYELATPHSFGALEKGATLELQIRKLKLYDEAERQLAEAVDDLDNTEDVRTRGTAARRELSEVTDIHVARRRLKQLLGMIEVAKAHLRGAINIRPPASESRGLLARLFHSMKSNMLLMSSMFNFISGGVISRPSVEVILGGSSSPLGLAKAPAKATAGFVGLVNDTITHLAAGIPGMADWMRANRHLLRPFLNGVLNSMDAAMRSRDLIPSSDAGILDEVVMTGPAGSEFNVSGPGRTRAFKIADALLTAPLLRHVGKIRDNILNGLERATTITSMIHADKFMRTYMARLARIIEARARGGQDGSLDFSNPANRFTARELASVGIGLDAWARALKLFSTSRRIEQVAFDYYQRRLAIRQSGGDWRNIPWTEDQGVWDDIVVKLAGLNNLPLRSNRPDVVRERTQLGDIARVAILFPGWANGYLSTLQMMMAVSSRRKQGARYAVSAMNVALVAASLATLGLGLAQIRAWLYRLIYGRPYPAETLTDLMESPSGEMGARTLASAFAATIPYFGEYIATALGAQNFRGSFTDLSNTSLPLKMADTIYNTARTLAITGDTAGAALSLQRGMLPPASPIINRLPAVEARNASANAVRVARIARGNIEVPDRLGTGRGYQPTRSGNLVNRAIAAASSGDMQEALRLRALALKAAADEGKDDPEGTFLSSVNARSPDMKAFGRRLTQGERESMLSRMGASDRAAYLKAEQAVQKLAAVSGKQRASAGVSSVIRKLRGKVRPPAIKAVRGKIRTIRQGGGHGPYVRPRLLPRQARQGVAPSLIRPSSART